jgi:predicted signal transduction protein with EAL and GGDEF domain
MQGRYECPSLPLIGAVGEQLLELIHHQQQTALRRRPIAVPRGARRIHRGSGGPGQGDELAVVLRETSVRDAQSLADRLLRAVRAIRLEREGTSFGLTVSIGIAELEPDEKPERWLERSDRALYQAKNAGRDRVVAADKSVPPG